MPLKNQTGRLFRALMFIVLSDAAIGTAFAGYQPLAPESYLDWNAKERVFLARQTSKERGGVLIIADNDELGETTQKNTGKTATAATAAPDKDAAHDWSLSANTDDEDWVRPKNFPHDYLVHRNNKKGGGRKGRLDRDDLDPDGLGHH